MAAPLKFIYRHGINRSWLEASMEQMFCIQDIRRSETVFWFGRKNIEAETPKMAKPVSRCAEGLLRRSVQLSRGHIA
jgi:hypothetical protein